MSNTADTAAARALQAAAAAGARGSSWNSGVSSESCTTKGRDIAGRPPAVRPGRDGRSSL